MKDSVLYQIKSGRKAYAICLLWIVIGLSGLFGCSKTEEYVVAVDDGFVAENAESTKSPDLTYEQPNALSEPGMIYVDVCGAVCYPGVYRLTDGARVYEVLELAGGMKDDACIRAVNQAECLTDGQKLYIPTQEEWEQETMELESETEDDGRVNINTADLTKLCTLPGIGETRAQAIIAYREANGNFESVEAIQNVSGIKSGTYEKIKTLIKIQ